MVERNKKKLLHNCTEKEFGNFNSLRKNIKATGIVIINIKKYRPHTTCKKCNSVDKYLAIPSIKGRRSHPDKFNK